MKHIIVLGDGMSDYPLKNFKGKTPLDAAHKPNMDSLSSKGQVGTMYTLYDDLPLGSDVANLSVLGYDPHLYYTGRSPIEALGLGVPLNDNDTVFRLNLVSLSDDEKFSDKIMLDHSSDKISTEEASKLLKSLQTEFESDEIKLFTGISYRHILVLNNQDFLGDLTPPHDILGRKIETHLPKGGLASEFLNLMKLGYELLSAHPVNIARKKQGLLPANCPWLWGEGKAPKLPPFKKQYGIEKGIIIAAVPLIKGLAVALGLDSADVPGATGDYYTDYKAKAGAAIDALSSGYDFVFVHIEAPDECGHDGDAMLKKSSIEKIDKDIIGPIISFLESQNENYKILITPDHATPVSIRTHSLDPVPFLLYDGKTTSSFSTTYSEETADMTNLLYKNGHMLMRDFLKKE